MQNSALLLLLAIVLLWLAVTDQLSRLLDAYDVLVGNAESTGPVVGGNGHGTSGEWFTSTASRLPVLPVLTFNNAQVSL